MIYYARTVEQLPTLTPEDSGSIGYAGLGLIGSIYLWLPSSGEYNWQWRAHIQRDAPIDKNGDARR
jgi:hypothetical protein